MRLVIDIPDRIRYGIEIGITVNGSEASQIVLDAVKNGISLPKGHGDLIDRNELTVDHTSYDWDDYVSVEQIKNAKVVVAAEKENE